jgi:hypothetical protein
MAEADLPEGLQWGRQMELFGDEPAPNYGPDAERMRAQLHAMLAEARAAQAMPWPPLDANLNRLLFPQMTFCLPEDEGAQLRLEFATEMARLDAAE